eukprot:COSAG06_NODE_28184_length_580_cov_0.591667_1_plen_77_part_00
MGGALALKVVVLFLPSPNEEFFDKTDPRRTPLQLLVKLERKRHAAVPSSFPMFLQPRTKAWSDVFSFLFCFFGGGS